jgi:hypothetical protein
MDIANFNGHWTRSAKADAPNNVNNFYYINTLK